MDKLIKQLKADGIEKGLCRAWQMKLRAGLSLEQLVKLYVRGIDFCISEDYPTLDYLREHFKGKCEQYGVFVDDEVVGLKNAANVVLNGDCKAMLEYDAYAVSQVYVRHNSNVSINVADNAIVTVDAFDDSKLYVAVAGSEARITINAYGNAQIKCITPGVIIKRNNKNTY